MRGQRDSDWRHEPFRTVLSVGGKFLALCWLLKRLLKICKLLALCCHRTPMLGREEFLALS